MKKKVGLIFIILFLFIDYFILINCIFNKNQYNQIELRESCHLKFPKFKKINDGSYQTELEQALSDQFFMSDYLKILKNKTFTFININTIKLLNINIKNKYIKLSSDGLNKFNNKLVSNPIFPKDVQFIDKEIDKINNLKLKNNVNIFLYYVPIGQDISFENNERFNYKNELEKRWKLDSGNISFLEIKNFNEYNEYFYNSDYHWNYKGSYKGYTDIANMMKLNNILEPAGEECYKNIKLSGYYNRKIGNLNYFKEKVCIYKFSNKMANIKNDFDNKNEVNYEMIYGFNKKIKKFNNKNIHSNKNLLIYSDSFSNAIDNLLATHFDNTYSIDGRYYDKFDMDDFIKKQKITDIVFLIDRFYFVDKKGW